MYTCPHNETCLHDDPKARENEIIKLNTSVNEP